jgi:uncharacterized protein
MTCGPERKALNSRGPGDGRSGLIRGPRFRALLVVAIIACTLALVAVSSGGCALTRVVNQVSVTKRGLDVLNALNKRSGDGYDVREARAKWLAALQAYQKQDFTGTDTILDQTEALLAKAPKVSERIFYKSAGDITVSGLVFKPPGNGPWPAVIVNHAGFGTGADFSDVALMIRDHGYVVLNPDFRGSGESQGKHEVAKGEVDDVINGIKYLKEHGLVDGDRVAMYGQSHGAAVSMLAAERYPVKAVVEEAGFCDAAGIYNNIASSTDPAAKDLFNQVAGMIDGTPQQNPQEYYVRSAINYVNDMTAAVLLIHGAKDPLIPVEQAYRMYDALKAAGKTAELKIYPNEAHCVNDPAGRLEVWQMMFDWFKKNGV